MGHPDLGCDLWKILFEPMTDDTLERARLAVVEAVDRWLPFIELTDFQITKSDAENSLNINCIYRFRSNPNVTDQVAISTAALGAPAVAFPFEPSSVPERLCLRIIP